MSGMLILTYAADRQRLTPTSQKRDSLTSLRLLSRIKYHTPMFRKAGFYLLSCSDCDSVNSQNCRISREQAEQTPTLMPLYHYSIHPEGPRNRFSKNPVGTIVPLSIIRSADGLQYTYRNQIIIQRQFYSTAANFTAVYCSFHPVNETPGTLRNQSILIKQYAIYVPVNIIS